MSLILELAQALQSSAPGVALAESAYAFPLIEAIHLIGLSVSVGLIFLIDLRLVGVILKNVPIPDLLHQLRGLVIGGFVVIFISGFLLFWSEAATVIVSPAFPVKFLFIAIAGVNALYFELRLARQPPVLENHAVLPANIRYAGLASLFSWGAVIIAGRLIPYLP
ncbi:DUF6644 family protein [Dechloromonas denitrificans]|uniref:DUF6644 family protein n=1 Tax=Dechloromonas denitrificans TaxID=281362 RepID=UPI001CF90E7A|nr:DUF6644 family protein [Dechloromonas denitrificans]UCV01664.1 hypothetical protein KI611_11050 [Dechloromonas denitrificans]